MSEILANLNEEQKKAVTYGDGPLLIVAGAGTGKTTVITRRIAHLILEKGVPTDGILALTFTEQAAGEMEERVDRLLPYGYVDLWISTFHSFCERILREHGLEIGLAPDFKILNQTKQWLLIRQNLDLFHLNYYKPLGNPSKFIHAFIRHFSRCKDQEIYPEIYVEYAQKQKLDSDQTANDLIQTQEIQRISEIADAYHIYQRLLQKENAVDFGDLINGALKLFRERPKTLQEYREKFQHILVDEFQDTNWAQFDLVKLLSEPKNNLTVVADDDQSIYRFRGASMGNILEFKKCYPESREIFLIQNYRTKQNILDLAHQFIQLNNPNRLEYQLQKENSGGSSSFSQQISKKLISNTGSAGAVEHLHKNTLDEECETVVRKIVSLYKETADAQWKDFAILVRANNQADWFIDRLERDGIPYTYVASKGLYSKSVVLDVLAYLRFVNNIYDTISGYRVLNMPLLNLSHEDIAKLVHHCNKKTVPLYAAIGQAALLGLSPESQSLLSKLKSLVDQHAGLCRRKRTCEIAYAFLTDSGYLKYLESLGEKSYQENINYLNQFFKFIESFEKDSADRQLRGFLDFMDLLMEAGDEGNLASNEDLGPDTIKIMTVHASKGLEFKYVFVVNLVDLRFPSTQKSEPIEIPDELIKERQVEGDIHLEEERRLFYVALTRARDGVFFTSSSDYGGSRRKKISRFLTELGFKEPESKGDGSQFSALKRTAGASVFIPATSGQVPATSGQVPAKAEDKIARILPSKFSFTQLKVFDTCPWQYRYAHLIKLPVMGRGTFSFGQTIHSALQKFYQLIMDGSRRLQGSLFTASASADLLVPPLDKLLELYDQSWVDDWYLSDQQKESYRGKGRAILTEFYKKHEGKFSAPLHLEMSFNLKIGKYTLIGKIDRVDPAPSLASDEVRDKVEIIDYKTGSVPEDLSKIDKWNKNQLLIYQLAVEEILKRPVKQVTFYYVEENRPISFVGNPADLVQLKEEILAMIEAIKNSRFEPRPNPFTCKYCDYRNICEFREI